jgi:imidazolonepropionase-like amidohydrolase
MLFVLAVSLVAVQPADQPIAYVNARILTAAGPAIDDGTLVVKGAKVVAVGKATDVQVPGDARKIDAKGMTIIPGLVDTHSHLGLFGRPGGLGAGGDGNEGSGPVQGGIRAMDAVNAMEPSIRMATAGGVTTANIMPGSGNAIGGQTIYVKLRGDTIEQMKVEAMGVLGGLKMANGENPKRMSAEKKTAPVTRMKIASLQRSEFIKAREYMKKWDRYRQKLAANPKDDSPPPDVNLDLEPLVEVLQRKRTVHFHTHRADDILTTLRLMDEFGFELVIQHGTESYKVADEIARRKVPVSMTVVDSPGGKPEVLGLTERCGAELVKKGIKVIINTDDPITDSRFLMRTAATAVRGGLDPAIALQAITKNAAEVLHLDHRLGTLAVGKDADFVVLSGDPFSVYTRVLETYIDGQRIFNVADADQRGYRFGGFGLPADRRPAAPAVIQDRPAAPKVMVDFDAVKNAKKPTQETTSVLVYARRLHTVSHGTIEDGAVYIKDGKIAFVGGRVGFNVPPNTPTLAAHDVTPGLVDAFSQVPLSGQYNLPADQDQDEKSGPVQADLRVLDAFNPREPQLAFLLEQGVTLLHACPGRANVIAGQTGVFRTFGRTAESMAIRAPHALLVNLGNVVKAGQPGQKPTTRMGTASLVRNAFVQAAGYQRKSKAAKEEARPERNLANESLAAALDKKVGVVFAAQRRDDINTALRLTKEFNLKSTVALASEGFLAADELAAAKLPMFLHPTMQTPADLETWHTFLGNAAVLADRKILFGIASGMESYVPKTRVARYEAAVAANYGLGWQRALRAITLDAATTLDLADQFGSLEVGKAGDLVLYDGDPFEYTTHVQRVIIGGASAYDREEKLAIPFDRAVFFFSAGGEMPCCLGF